MKNLKSSVLACAILFAGAAQAGGPLTLLGSPNQTAFFGNSFLAQASPIVDTWTFTTVNPVFANGGVISVAFASSDWDFSSVVLSGPSGVFNFLAAPSSTDASEVWNLSSSALSLAGAYELKVTGSVLTPATVGSYSGNLNLSPIPEPGTYALMLAGLGAMAFVARRRRPA